MKPEFSRQIFVKVRISNFMEIRLVGAAFFHNDGRTDGETDRPDAANSRSSQFCERV